MKEKYSNETLMAAEASTIPNLEAFTYKALTPRGGGHRFASPRLARDLLCFVQWLVSSPSETAARSNIVGIIGFHHRPPSNALRAHSHNI